MTNYNKLAIWEEEDEEQIGYLRKPTWLYYSILNVQYQNENKFLKHWDICTETRDAPVWLFQSKYK